MTIPSIRAGDVGTLIQRTITEDGEIVDLSGATVTLIVVRPGRSTVARTMSFVNDGTDGKVQYKVVAEDDMWNRPGKYASQCVVHWSDTDEFASRESRFSVGNRRQVE